MEEAHLRGGLIKKFSSKGGGGGALFREGPLIQANIILELKSVSKVLSPILQNFITSRIFEVEA